MGKLITGKTTPDFWQGPTYPNSTSNSVADVRTSTPVSTTVHCASGCLFNVVEDPTEQNNVYEQNPSRVSSMKSSLESLTSSFFQNKDKFQNDCPDGTKQIWELHGSLCIDEQGSRSRCCCLKF